MKPDTDNTVTDTSTSSDLVDTLHFVETAPDGSQMILRMRPTWQPSPSKYVN